MLLCGDRTFLPQPGCPGSERLPVRQAYFIIRTVSSARQVFLCLSVLTETSMEFLQIAETARLFVASYD
jgi:hypothetical protein